MHVLFFAYKVDKKASKSAKRGCKCAEQKKLLRTQTKSSGKQTKYERRGVSRLRKRRVRAYGIQITGSQPVRFGELSAMEYFVPDTKVRWKRADGQEVLQPASELKKANR